MFYDGAEQPICHQLKEPPLYHKVNAEALSYWNFLASDRPSGQSPTTIRTDTISDFCRSSSLPYEMFLRIKIIENVYYSITISRYSKKMNEIRNKK